MRTAEDPFPMETMYTWKALDNGLCMMTHRNRGSPGGFSKLFVPIRSLMMKIEKTWKNLSQFWKNKLKWENIFH
jgi:hypothetical protein